MLLIAQILFYYCRLTVCELRTGKIFEEKEFIVRNINKNSLLRRYRTCFQIFGLPSVVFDSHFLYKYHITGQV